MEENRKYNIDTMTGVGKKIQIAGREYEVLPINIEDMHYVIGEENIDERLFIPMKKEIEEGTLTWASFGLNIMEPRRTTFMKMINKYVFYKEKAVTEQMLIEHNWSFKEIGKFLYCWIQEVSE